ncbi:DEAD-box ATP-dependent RNA helicase 16-like isoform X1 [Tasmannia lanceolata]|uniref:DEAD-box ATP-dependent RNA helicase 16-like isoform X1 n=1 Tax=Tasmannia lanceolata TaxID=3420 RepID=UPI0040632AE8
MLLPEQRLVLERPRPTFFPYFKSFSRTLVQGRLPRVPLFLCRPENCANRLKAHFEDNPRDLNLLKHDIVLSRKPPPSHLRVVPDYLLDPTTQEASKIVKLARAAVGKTEPRRLMGPNRRIGRGRDPLKTFSAETRKKSHKGGKKRKEGKEGGADHLSKRKKKARHAI